MREIKFRVWDKDINKYVYISETVDGGFWVNNGISQAEMPTNRDSFEQYTGLKDKNGKEVYEGDIVEGTMGIFEVKWYDKISRFSFVPNIDMEWHPAFVCDQLKEMEVIGNVHENKELVGGKE